ncbi:hypothetical protein LCGC14_0673790 [marine sediment metagenome]|uniref:Uncharacterized protein n=1 Tax=marine sediment metagenome TaxID=412755 RepID=A0A0F9TBP7_9ZZZZ
MTDPEKLSAELYEANLWAEENPDAWLSILLSLEMADDCLAHSV